MERRDGAEATPRADASLASSFAPKTPGNKAKVMSTNRRLNVTENKDMVMMEKLLFEDDRKQGEFLKSLISSNGLRSAYDDMSKRMQSCEDLCVEMLNKTSPSALKEDFVTRSEYVEKVEGMHSATLKDHEERLGRHEADKEAQHALNEDYGRQLNDHYRRLGVQEQGLASAREELARMEAQGLERHEAVLASHSKAVEMEEQRSAALQSEIRGVSTRLRNEENLRVALADEVASQKKFLFGEKLTEHVKTVLLGILADYVRKDELHAEAQTATNIILKPVLAGFNRLKTDVGNTNYKNEERFEAIEEGLRKANFKITEDCKDFNHRIDEVDNRVDLSATNKSLQEKEAALLAKVKQNETSVKEVKKVSGLKLSELVTRLVEYQTILEDHEHALQHQAEELLNRSTKYDLMLCERRIDDCALREKVDGEVKDLQNMARWQSAKLEKLCLHIGFSGRRRAAGENEAGDGFGEEGPEVSQMDSLRQSTSLFVDSRGTGATELVGMLREQLERVAQGILGLSHLVFRGVSLPTASREDRQLREAEMIHHLSCIVDWITHKKAPADWDTVKFTSLVMSLSVPSDFDRRRSALLSVSRGPSSRSSIMPSQRASAMSSLEEEASPTSPTPSTTPSPRVSNRSSALRRATGQATGQASTQEEAAQDARSQASTSKQAPRIELTPVSARTSRLSPVPPTSTLTTPPDQAPQVAHAAQAGGNTRLSSAGGGFRGRLVKSRFWATTGHTEGSISAMQAEVLPRLVAALEEDDGGTP